MLSAQRDRIMDGEGEFLYMPLYEFEDYRNLDPALNSSARKKRIEEYNEAFDLGGRKRIKAV